MLLSTIDNIPLQDASIMHWHRKAGVCSASPDVASFGHQVPARASSKTIEFAVSGTLSQGQRELRHPLQLALIQASDLVPARSKAL